MIVGHNNKTRQESCFQVFLCHGSQLCMFSFGAAQQMLFLCVSSWNQQPFAGEVKNLILLQWHESTVEIHAA